MDETTQATKTDAVPAPTGATQATDLHKSKISPDDPRLRIERPRSRTLRRGPALAVMFAVIGVAAVALVVALGGASNDQGGKKENSQRDVSTTNPVTLPDVIKEAPIVTNISPATAAGGGAGTGAPIDPSVDNQRQLARQATREEMLRARGAGIFAGADEGSNVVQQPQGEATGHKGGAREGDSGPTASPPGTAEPKRSPDPNLQERKNDFLAKDGVSNAEYLEKGVTLPRSPFEVKAGSVIPTVLISGIDSDLPGQVVAQVRENVYDTVTGNYLLIPQGSRLLAAYDSMVAWGQERVLVCWNRLIRPDGSSITLECMPGVDLAGYAGFADEVDNHWWKIITGAVFSSVLAATAQRSQGDVTGFQPTFSQTWASNAAGQINQTGQQLTQKSLQIQPTITVRPGFSVNVLVTKDIVITPYNRQGVTP